MIFALLNIFFIGCQKSNEIKELLDVSKMSFTISQKLLQISQIFMKTKQTITSL